MSQATPEGWCQCRKVGASAGGGARPEGWCQATSSGRMGNIGKGSSKEREKRIRGPFSIPERMDVEARRVGDDVVTAGGETMRPGRLSSHRAEARTHNKPEGKASDH